MIRLSSWPYVSSKLTGKSSDVFNKSLHSCKYINIIFVSQIFVTKQKNIINIKRMVVSSRLKESNYSLNT